MTTGAGDMGVPDAQAGLAAWRAAREAGTIQFAPLPRAEQPRPPGWLERLGRWLSELFDPLAAFLANLFGGAWPFVRVLLFVALAAGILLLVWKLVEPFVGRPRREGPAPAAEWAPERAEAEALLEDADRLAGEGRFDEATHLLLRRSVAQIARAHPEWVEPSSTARELAALPTLPEQARGAFGLIAERVERSLFALRALSRDDWQAARGAYADFALARL